MEVLAQAIEEHDHDEFDRLMSNNKVYVNYQFHGLKTTLLHTACANRNSHALKRLLAHPKINPNIGDFMDTVPFSDACADADLECARLLYNDPRVDINALDTHHRTPLWVAAVENQYEAMRFIIAGPRFVSKQVPRGGWFNLGWLMPSSGRCSNLLDEYMANPLLTQFRVRIQLNHAKELAASAFINMLLVTEGLLQTKNEKKFKKAKRFFAIAARLPMDLQMVLAHRSIGSHLNTVPSNLVELGLQNMFPI